MIGLAQQSEHREFTRTSEEPLGLIQLKAKRTSVNTKISANQ
jgi:hypothetical protein